MTPSSHRHSAIRELSDSGSSPDTTPQHTHSTATHTHSSAMDTHILSTSAMQAFSGEWTHVLPSEGDGNVLKAMGTPWLKRMGTCCHGHERITMSDGKMTIATSGGRLTVSTLFLDGREQELPTLTGSRQTGTLEWDGTALVGTFKFSSLVMRRYLRQVVSARLNPEVATTQMCVEYRLPNSGKGGTAVTVHVFEPSSIAPVWHAIDNGKSRHSGIPIAVGCGA